MFWGPVAGTVCPLSSPLAFWKPRNNCRSSDGIYGVNSSSAGAELISRNACSSLASMIQQRKRKGFGQHRQPQRTFVQIAVMAHQEVLKNCLQFDRKLRMRTFNQMSKSSPLQATSVLAKISR